MKLFKRQKSIYHIVIDADRTYWKNGDPIVYKYIGYLAAKAIDDVNRSNVLMSRILGGKISNMKNGEPL